MASRRKMGDNLLMTSNDIIARLVKESMGFHYPRLTSEELIAMAQHIAYLDQSNDDLIETIKRLNEEQSKVRSYPTGTWSCSMTGYIECNECGNRFYINEDHDGPVWTYCPACGSKNR